ncbi:hypothetical protein EYV94_19005 [Puteibacter caeruleilacunae]|nr:hypothetical protein EYV94_19005 [Puteibacter caeruleilacunae]
MIHKVIDILKRLIRFRGDKVVWIVLFFLSLSSLLIVYSATGSLAFRKMDGQTGYYLVRQLIFISAGLGIILFQVNFIPVRFYSKIATPGLIIAFGVVVVGLLMGAKTEATGRTLNLLGFSFQPAELAKLVMVMYVARMLANHQESRDSRRKAFWLILIGGGLLCFAVFIGNFSTSALMFATVMCMMFIGRVPFKFLGGTVVAGIVLMAILLIATPIIPKSFGRIHTVKGRIERFFTDTPEEEKENKGLEQEEYGLLAVYEGGLLGKGPGASEVANYMAAAYNDFIFAIFIEEYGLIGGGMVLLLYLIFMYRGGVIMKRSTRTFPAFLTIGYTLILTFQAMINMGVAVGALPVTGQPLPLVSMGGTSTLFTAAMLGCVLSVSCQNQKDKKLEPEMTKMLAAGPDEDQKL